ncbi:hypothetical protein [Roseimicrobium gellanilyticum]|uniref:hypothetical protein n=1 Tax=Roseimicrobium gellanilyticum TaxID=748857 RepID=UPI001473DAC2|nr:hypothetical protein [Roseimicrobium gellanilyticum]
MKARIMLTHRQTGVTSHGNGGTVLPALLAYHLMPSFAGHGVKACGRPGPALSRSGSITDVHLLVTCFEKYGGASPRDY